MIPAPVRTVAAEAIPKFGPVQRPGDPVLYACAGTNEHGERCRKLLLIWRPPADPVTGSPGRAEVKCRRCKALNVVSPTV